MNALRVYRDDGPLAQAIARASAAAKLPVGPLVLLLGGVLPLIVIFAVWSDALPPAAAGLAALAVLVGAAGAGAPRADRGRLAWLVPPLLRVVEYGVLLRIAVLSDHRALPACYALLGALAFHHYDSVYRLRHQKVPPPAWLGLASGGWDGRLVVLFALAAAGALRPALIVAAVALGAVFVTESVVSWLHFARAEARTVYDDEDVEDN
jgi:Family of unknown function (DUF5941)